jgi:hypothetical protein
VLPARHAPAWPARVTAAVPVQQRPRLLLAATAMHFHVCWAALVPGQSQLVMPWAPRLMLPLLVLLLVVVVVVVAAAPARAPRLVLPAS